MTSFWQGFFKQASAAAAIKGALGKARTFGKGALVGAGATAAGMSLAQSMAKAPTLTPAQQGY